MAGVSPARAADTAEPPLIFNGHDFTGWNVPQPNPFWKIVDGVLIGENDTSQKGSVLRTEKSYRNFDLELEVRWTDGADSGILFRQPDLQVQLGVSNSLKVDMTGSFYTGGKDMYPAAGRARGVDRLLKPGAWNKIRLKADDATFTVWLNGTQVTLYANANFAAPAPIGLQIHQKIKMKVELRNIRLKPLE